MAKKPVKVKKEVREWMDFALIESSTLFDALVRLESGTRLMLIDKLAVLVKTVPSLRGTETQLERILKATYDRGYQEARERWLADRKKGK